MQKFIFRISFINLLFVFLFTINVSADVTINRSELCNGIIQVKTNENATKRVKVVIEKDNYNITYDILKYDEFEKFALTNGNGKYKVEVYQNLEGLNYKRIFSTTADLNVIDEKEIFKQSTQEVNFKSDSKVVKYAKDLVKDAKTDKEKLEILYRYIIREYTYNTKKIYEVESTYIPDIDKVFSEKSGICYDFSVLFAAILRSNDIPTKLVKGYSDDMPGKYHSWNEVYLDGKWIILDTSMDSNRYHNFLEYEMNKDKSKYVKNLEY